MANGTTGIFHGMKSVFCQEEYGQIAPVYSISAGLDYPGIGPEHAMLADEGRAQYVFHVLKASFRPSKAPMRLPMQRNWRQRWEKIRLS